MFKGHWYPKAVILQAVYFKLGFTLSYRDVEELMQMRGIKVDHATIQRWVFKFSKLIEDSFRTKSKTVGRRWRLDETYIKVKGRWMYLYRAVDKEGHTVDFLLTKRRNEGSAQKSLNKAIGNNGPPELINIDKSGANKVAIWVYNRRNFSRIKYRQVKYLNNIVEQDHRFIKWKVWPMLGFKSFESAQRTLTGIEIVRMIKKSQLENPRITTFKSFCSLAR